MEVETRPHRKYAMHIHGLLSQPGAVGASLTNMIRVPKELIAQFVKACPTCQQRRPITRRDDVGPDDKRLLDSKDDSDAMLQDEADSPRWEPSSPASPNNEHYPTVARGGKGKKQNASPSANMMNNSESSYRYNSSHDYRDSPSYWHSQDLHGFPSAERHRYPNIHVGYLPTYPENQAQDWADRVKYE